MDAEVAPVPQPGQDRLRQRPEPELKRGAVLDQPGDFGGNRALDRARRSRRWEERAPRRADDEVEVGLDEGALAMGPGRLVIDLGDHDARGVEGGDKVFVRDAQAVAALFIGRRRLEEEDVDLQGAAADQLRILRIVARQDVERAGFAERAVGPCAAIG